MDREEAPRRGDYYHDAATLSRIGNIAAKWITAVNIAAGTTLVAVDAYIGHEMSDDLVNLAKGTGAGIVAMVGFDLLHGYFENKANERQDPTGQQG